MEFVVYVLKYVFSKSEIEAFDIMMKVHTEGVGLCGVYSHEIAETKTSKVNNLAKRNGHPLRCSYEPE